MKKILALSMIAFLFLGSSILSVQAPGSEENSGTGTDPIYTYDINVGDNFVYNVVFNITLGFENQSVVSEIDRWLNETYSTEDYADISDSWMFISDLVGFINQDLQINLTISQKYLAWENKTEYYGDTRYSAYDVFNASIRMRENGDDEWITPAEFEKNKVDEFVAIAVNNSDLEADDPSVVNYTAEAKESIDNEPMDWDNTEISRVQSDYKYYYENGTLYDPTTESDYDPNEPSAPLEHFEPSGLPFFLPNTFNFSEWLGYAESDVNYDVAQTNVTDRTFDSFDDYISKMGIIALNANEHGIGIAFTSDDADETFFTSETGNNLTEIKENLKDYLAVFHGAIEYDDSFALASFVSYMDFSFSLDTMETLANNESAPYIKDEKIQLGIVTSVVQDGFTAPTPEQIESGELGDDRDMEVDAGFFGFLDSIPGYSNVLIGILGLVSVVGLIVKNHKK
ncbi:hypothetical protein NEF87_003770 [Candidatus Lokiarchaeum ossiferum]|uniref:Uncharacterized protein n=1 Tax=Candidatus Lokiarchaeum ossiferum TaxID=2951803 RepID=A0ABY6HVD5_9ARCH|nr:hypothetical protein NEF87_003770 [Candidatus Lokiarchaeum sp. B-35]